VKWCVTYLTKTKTKFRLPLKLSLLRGSCAKSARASPTNVLRMLQRFHPNRFTFCGVIAECVNSAKLPHKVNPIYGRSLEQNKNTHVKTKVDKITETQLHCISMDFSIAVKQSNCKCRIRSWFIERSKPNIRQDFCRGTARRCVT